MLQGDPSAILGLKRGVAMSTLLHEMGSGFASRTSGRRPVGGKMRRLGLAIFFVSIAVNAALGIYAVLAPDFGETQGKILGTSLCVTGAVVLALACEPAWERRLLGPVPLLGAFLGGVGFTLAITGIWTGAESEIWGKTMGTIFTVAVACAVASLLVLARLAPRHAWIFTVTLALLGLGAAMMSFLMWQGDDPPAGYVRALGVVMIVLAAFTVTVPVLHWVDRGTLAAAEAATGAVRFCPYCGRELAHGMEVDLRCGRCGREFTITAAVEPQSERDFSVNLT
jgi:ribosomal protein S27AE